jgi:hypothetical protein
MRPFGTAVSVPIQVGTLQDTSVDFDWSEKVLQGSSDAAAAIARGALKISGKIKSAKFSVADLSQVVFGTTPSQGSIVTADNEGLPLGLTIPAAITLDTSAATASGSTLPFTSTTGVVVGQPVSGAEIAAGTAVASIVANTSVTLTKPILGAVSSGSAIVFGPSLSAMNAATFVDDLGVINVNTGLQMTPVVSDPSAGEYVVNNGVYLFAIADVGQEVALSYEYSQSTAGSSFTYYSQPMGYRPTFKMVLSNEGFMNNPSYQGQPIGLTLWSAGINKFSLDFKNEDWTIPESDFSASQDYLQRVFTMGANS